MATKLSDLPKDLLSIICEKLVDVSDYARFRAVCKSWRTIVWQTRTKIPPQLPMLIFPLSSYISSTYMHTHSFYTFSMNREFIKEVQLETTLFKNCYGSSHGWLITEDYHNRIQLILNPFQMDNNVINLPILNLREHVISRVVLSHSPTLTTDYVVMVLYYSYSYMLSFLKPGDKYWTHVTSQEEKDLVLNDVIYYRDGFYAVSLSGELIFCDISSTQPRFQRVAAAPIPNISMGWEYINSCYVYTRMSLVESSGDLLCVVRLYSETIKLANISTIGFQIFKLQANGWEWIELKTLQGHALFLGDSFSSSLLASDFNHCRPNHIYFTDPSSPNKFAMGVFNLADSSVKVLYSKNTKKDAIRPVWIQPTLNMTRNKNLDQELCST
ncbi:hypothetical protein AQUCO_13600004v1 [Aquilegia coerulea]|uniref:F-box domain-containing protein n=1 Tax=Aquilegia coerulea TaxID=218851 RepID=A0A2G5C118_AQUCA|nr:hypothetical protein AQUCO_13600004v1 [Aquilegia coerulea]